MIQALIIDDERLARSDLRGVLKAFPQITITGEAANIREAEEMIMRLRPQLLFLDIEMPEGNGFDLLERLTTTPHVIFTTAYDAYAIQAFEINALDYLLKPVTEKRLEEALARIPATVPAASAASYFPIHEKIFVKDGDRCWFVPLADIRLLEAADDYVRLRFGKHAPLLPRSLQSLEQKLDPQFFFRASRRHIVNLQHVQSVSLLPSQLLQLEMTDGSTVPVSRRQTALFRELRGI
ncbi:LytR/AlgR family response regulator transcription factor [Chitinophaga deserti]|uniref:LytR/AlgR family response regulator transcription factor n=1 Tax=Chitinophaga deserti TaxID=2164099 RepID=UPI0018E57664|nr:LytTR family DNA-binding domain-containing protein [Chitinophaga deserti]